MPTDLRKDPAEHAGTPPDKIELNQVADIVKALVKTAKSFQIYLPNNPLLQTFSADLQGKIRSFHELHGNLKIDVAENDFGYHGRAVYHNLDPQESLPFRLYADGIRSLVISDGVEREELDDFVKIMGAPFGYADDNIVTRLWDRGLPHFSCIMDDDYFEIDLQAQKDTIPPPQQENLSRLLQALSRAPIPPLPSVSPSLLTLAAAEVEWLRHEREAYENTNPIDDVIAILAAILEWAPDVALFNAFLKITADAASNLILSGDLGHFNALVTLLHDLARSDFTAVERRSLTVSVLASFLSEKYIDVVCKAIEHDDSLGERELLYFLYTLGSSSLEGLCELLGMVANMKKRRIVLQAVINLGRDDPRRFAPFLADRRWFLVRNIVCVLTRLKDPIMTEPVANLISHKDSRVRKEVLTFLEIMPDQKAKTYIIRFLRDESQGLRIKALQTLERMGNPSALKSIAAMVDREDFDQSELVEKKAVYEAIGELGQDRMLPMFRDMLLKRHWFKKFRQKEETMCAIYGLTRIRSEESVKLLQGGLAAVKDETLRESFRRAIESIGTTNRERSHETHLKRFHAG